MTASERNVHYGMLNDRFEGRSRRLRDLGFRYVRLEEHGIAVFAKTQHGKTHSISAGTVMNADAIVWADTLARAEAF